MRLCGPIWRVASIPYNAQWDFVVLYDASRLILIMPNDIVWPYMTRRVYSLLCPTRLCRTIWRVASNPYYAQWDCVGITMRLCGPIWRVASIPYNAQWDYVVLYDASRLILIMPNDIVWPYMTRRVYSLLCPTRLCRTIWRVASNPYYAQWDCVGHRFLVVVST
jgi:hypothetical protein